MCFLKTFKQLDSIAIEKGPESQVQGSQQNSQGEKENHSFLNQIFESKGPVVITKQDQLLLNLLKLITSNNNYLKDLDQKLTYNELHLASFLHSLNTTTPSPPLLKHLNETSDIQHGELTEEEPRKIVDPLVEKLFGRKKYDYQLQLKSEIPSTIYKERNINFVVQLNNYNHDKVLNSNMVHLCLGVCDANGQWITQNKGGENFMKGKTEVEMYHGEGSFLKVYPKEVSRSYPQGKLNFVIYPKPSVLKFTSNNSSLEKEVDSSAIEPLLIKDISIRAKKKD